MCIPRCENTMQTLPHSSLTFALSSHNTLLVIIAGSLLLVLIAFVCCRHAISRRLLSRVEAIKLAMQQFDRDHTLHLLRCTEKLLRTWDWLLNEHDQCGARRLIERAERIYAS